MSTSEPVEGKVWASVVGGGAGGTVATFLTWLLGVAVWHAPSTSDAATSALAAVPGPVTGLLVLVVGLGGVFAGGYLTKHTPRTMPDTEPEAEDMNERVEAAQENIVIQPVEDREWQG